jgi:site-specific recombinase XerD
MLNDLTQVRVVPTLSWQEEFATWMKFDAYKRGGGLLREKSLDAYLQSTRHFVRWFEQVRPAGAVLGMRFSLDHFTMDVMREYFAWQQAERVPAKSFNHRLTTLRKVARWAMGAGYIQDDPTRVIERVHKIEGAPRRKSNEEVTRIEAVASTGSHLKRQTERYGILGIRDQVIWHLFRCGLRVSEVADADVRDLDLENGTLRVIGKGGVEGDVTLTEGALEAVKTWLTVRSGLRFAASEFKLLTNWNGQSITDDTVRRRLEAMGLSASVQITPHDMRHTAIHQTIENLMAAGFSFESAVSAAQVQARHGDLRTTMSYVRVPREQVRAALGGR